MAWHLAGFRAPGGRCARRNRVADARRAASATGRPPLRGAGTSPHRG